MNAQEVDTLRHLYVDIRQELYTYAVSITRNREQAEDAIQAVFAKLLAREHLPADLRPYIFRSIRNAAYDGLRRAAVRSDGICDARPNEVSTDVAARKSLPAENFDQLLAQLSSDEREAIVLKIYSGLTFQEIADFRGVPMPTAASWYRRGLEQLRTLLSKDPL